MLILRTELVQGGNCLLEGLLGALDGLLIFLQLLGDLIGAILFPSGPFWPGFTIVAGLCGLMYGLLREKPGAPDSRMKFLLRTALVVSVVNVVMELGLNTGNLYMMYGSGVVAWVPGRILKCVCMIPTELLVINAIRPTIRTLSRRFHK